MRFERARNIIPEVAEGWQAFFIRCTLLRLCYGIRRFILLELTPEGEELLEAVNEKYGRLTESLWKDFSEEELANLHAYYARVVANLDLEEGTVK